MPTHLDPGLCEEGRDEGLIVIQRDLPVCDADPATLRSTRLQDLRRWRGMKRLASSPDDRGGGQGPRHSCPPCPAFLWRSWSAQTSAAGVGSHACSVLPSAVWGVAGLL